MGLMIAAASIATSPEVQLMDEPCSALAPIATAQLEALIDGLRSPFSEVTVTHSLQQAARVSQRTQSYITGRIG